MYSILLFASRLSTSPGPSRTVRKWNWLIVLFTEGRSLTFILVTLALGLQLLFLRVTSLFFGGTFCCEICLSSTQFKVFMGWPLFISHLEIYLQQIKKSGFTLVRRFLWRGWVGAKYPHRASTHAVGQLRSIFVFSSKSGRGIIY